MLLEVCIDCIESALAAEAGGAHRIEICGSLATGGITPSVGLVRQCAQLCTIPMVAMVRPHDGGFVYSKQDLDTMLSDIDAMKHHGLQGIVVGPLTREGDIDVSAMDRLIQTARPMQITFHRAFDVTRDPFQSLDVLIALGVDRLLTSGQMPTAEQGAALIRQLVERADGRIAIMAGAGVSSSNARQIVETTQVHEIHASASVPRTFKGTAQQVRFGEQSRVTSRERVQELITATQTST